MKDQLPTRPIRVPLTKELFAPLKPHEKKVLICAKLNDRQLHQVADLMRDHPDVGLEVLYSDVTDLDFLKYFPWLKQLKVYGSFHTLESIEGMRHLTQLEDLEFPATKKRFSLQILETFPNLTRLLLDGIDSKTPGLDAVTTCTQLRTLGLISNTFDNLDFLRGGLPNVWRLALNSGRCSDLDAITTLPSLRGLSLVRTRISGLTPIAHCAQLGTLYIESMSTVTELPDLSTAHNLRSITLSKLKNLADISPLLAAPALTYLTIRDLHPDLEPEDYAILNNHPTLKYVHVFGRNEKLDEEIARITHRKPGVEDAQSEYIKSLSPGPTR